MSGLRISVVICGYTETRWNQLVSAVASAQAQVYPADEVIVVTDHNPSLLSRVREQIGQVVAIENGEEHGLSGARNSGIAVAQGDVVAFLDDDAVASPHWLARLVEQYSNPRVSGVGGPIVPLWERNRPRWFPEEFDWVVGCTYRGMPSSEGNVRNLIGSNMSFRRSVFGRVGGFRTGFGQVGASMLRCDETEFCIRLRQNDPAHTFAFAPSALVFHHVPLERARWSYFQTRCFTEGIAKASLSQLLGSHDGLSSERAYALSALPRGVLRELIDVVRSRDLRGLARASAIVAGLTLTVAGYFYGIMSLPHVQIAPVNEDVQVLDQHIQRRQASAPFTVENGD